MAASATDSLISALQHQVATRDSALSIVGTDEALSYRQLWDWVEQVRAYVCAQGIGCGDRVVLIAENSPQYAAVFYGVLLAGAVVVPLNASARLRDFTNWLQHSGARLAFVDFVPRETHKLPEAALEATLCAVNRRADMPTPLQGDMPDWDSVLAANRLDEIPNNPAEKDLACILYTSGTTGNPKGVMISHANLIANVGAILKAVPIQEGDRFLNVLPFYYSYGNSVLHTHLIQGATLYLENSMMYPNRVAERMERDGITGFAGVPSTFSLLLSRGNLGEHDLSSLRYVLQAGGGMPVAITRQVQEQLCEQLFVMYGQTEATARLTCLRPDRLSDKMGSVGLPVEGVELEVRGPDGEPCAVGTQGELFVRGNNVAQGYWQNESATRATFVEGWLKTGDLGYRDSEGFVYLTGRRSDMIKSGANRISPAEIEEVIMELSEVEEVAVLGVADELLGQTIAAVVVIKPGQTLDVRRIKKHCLDNLASYKIPRRIIALDELPKTASGKVKKHILLEQIEEHDDT